MVMIARSPLRISLGGGGTDLPAYYKRHGGLVVSTTISYYVYTIVTTGSPDGVQIISADYRTFRQQPVCEDLIWNGDMRLPKAIARYFNVHDDLTIFLASQIPPGTGLGLSGSLAVSMIKALAFWCGLDLGPADVAELACQIEIEELGMPVGKQDQYAAAFGGLNCMRFSRAGVTVEPLEVSAETHKALERNLMLFFTGPSRQSSTILQQQNLASQQGNRATVRRLDAIKELGLEIRAALVEGNLETFGDLLHQSWMEKQQLTEGVTNPFINQCYHTAREKGALGGKLSGAGGGGFLMLYCPEERQGEVTQALADIGLQHQPFTLQGEGVQVMRMTSSSQSHGSNQISLVMEGVQIEAE
jgi:D-glycero-alpha-D-manno-heptose-7-phosphate kinase